MVNKNKIVSSVYQQIAVDIASNIVNGKYVKGQKLYGRSTLASLYNVSPETIRKAVHLLKDVEILDIEKGSGIVIKSIENADVFVGRYKETYSMTEIRNEMIEWSKKQRKELDVICEKIQCLIDVTGRFKNLNPFTPFEIKISSYALVINKTVSELNFWHNTGATIIAIKRFNNVIISPGPYATFLENDVFYLIGTDEALIRVKKLLFGE